MTDERGRRRILFICTANICRSPTAELLARQRFGESDLVFRSAGFLEADHRCPDELVEVLGAKEIDARDHRSYMLDDVSVGAADLLLTMEGSHVQKATMLAPDGFPKIVPLKEAAAVLDGQAQPQLSIEDFVDELNRNRDPRQYLGTKWDVADPFGGRVRAYRKAVAEIEQLVGRVIGSLH